MSEVGVAQGVLVGRQKLDCRKRIVRWNKSDQVKASPAHTTKPPTVAHAIELATVATRLRLVGGKSSSTKSSSSSLLRFPSCTFVSVKWLSRKVIATFPSMSASS